jgi:nucleoside-diphosphate-sugar epimerase
MAKKKIFIAGHRGLVGSALVRLYETRAEWEIVTRTRSELDLLDREAVREFFASEKPAAVILAAAKVGGIHANSTQQVEFLLQNMHIQNNVIEAAADHVSSSSEVPAFTRRTAPSRSRRNTSSPPRWNRPMKATRSRKSPV